MFTIKYYEIRAQEIHLNKLTNTICTLRIYFSIMWKFETKNNRKTFQWYVYQYEIIISDAKLNTRCMSTIKRWFRFVVFSCHFSVFHDHKFKSTHLTVQPFIVFLHLSFIFFSFAFSLRFICKKAKGNVYWNGRRETVKKRNIFR